MVSARAGTVLADVVGGLCGIALLFALSVASSRETALSHRNAERAAALEQAQNALARARAGAALELPPTWIERRTPVADGVDRLEVRGAGVSLSTLVRRPAAGRTP
jgi:hypothetical protein